MIKRSLHMAGTVLSSAAGLAPGSLPLIVAWVTDRCNLRCQMCNQWKSSNPELTYQEWFSVIKSAKKLNTMHITLTGGEPFIRQDIYSIIKGANSQGISVHVCSNGTLLDQAAIDKLKASPPNSISISLDSCRPGIHDELRGVECFERAVSAIRLAKTIPGLKVGINHLICKKNYRDLTGMVDLARKLGVDRLNVMPIHTNLQHRNKPKEEYSGLLMDKEDLPKFETEFRSFMQKSSKIQSTSKSYLKGIPKYFRGRAKRIACLAGHITCAVNAQGGVSPCDDMEPVANIRDMPLEKIWHSKKFHLARKNARACTAECWDTTHANLNLLLSPLHAIRELGAVMSSARYYIKR